MADERLTPLDQSVLEGIAKHGWYCIGVGAGDDGPNFSYSVGWTDTLSSPEAIIFGLKSGLQHSMLWELFRQIQKGNALVEGGRYDHLIQDFQCEARRVHPSHAAERLRFANWYHRRRNPVAPLVVAYQIFWPGKEDGLFPWDPGCTDAIREWQPRLQDAPQ